MQFTTNYLTIFYVSALTGAFGVYGLLASHWWGGFVSLAVGLVFGNGMCSCYARFPGNGRAYEEATKGGPSDLSCYDTVTSNGLVILITLIILPVIEKAYRKFHPGGSGHPFFPWLIVVPVILALGMAVAYRRDVKKNKSGEP